MFDGVLIALFVAALGAPTIDAGLRPLAERTAAAREMRNPVEWPGVPRSLAELAHEPGAIDAWFRDRMGLRDKLLRLRSRVRALGFGVSPLDEVDFTPDGWTFLRTEACREVWAGRLPFTDEELVNWDETLRQNAAACRALGAQHLFLIGPDKETIYPERVPSTWHKFGPSRLEQLHAWLDARGTNTLVDPRAALISGKAQDGAAPPEFLYYPLGTHWTPRGDYIAYREIHARLRQLLPGLGAPIPYSDLELRAEPNVDESWAYRAVLDDVYPQPIYDVKLAHPARALTEGFRGGLRDEILIGADPSAPRAVMFHDSFGVRVSQLLAPHFSRLHCVWTGRLDTDVVARERPDVVIEIHVERTLVTVDSRDMRDDLEGALALRRELEVEPSFVLTPALAKTETVAGPGLALRPPSVPDALLRLRLERDGGYALLPRMPASALAGARGSVVRIELFALGETELTLLPVLRGESEPREQPSASAAIVKGWNDVVVRLPHVAELERFALRPGRTPGRYLIYSFAVRPAASGG